MKSNLVISFAAGLVTGVTVAYLLITDRLQRQMDREIEERVDEVEKSAFQEYRENIDKLTAMYEKKALMADQEKKISDIEILDPETFQQGALGYEFFEVDCYVNDNVVADDNGNRMKETARELIGADAMTSGGAYGADPNEVYVRNHKYRMDLHVHLLDVDWVEDIDLGDYYYIPDEEDDDSE